MEGQGRGGGAAGDEDKQVSKRQTALVSISNGRRDVGGCFLLCRAAENSPNFTPHVKTFFATPTLETMLFCFFSPYLIRSEESDWFHCGIWREANTNV